VSITLMSAVWPLEIPPNEKLVILALADNANDAGECWPSMATLKLKTSLSERTIQRCLRELEAKSLVQVEARYGRSNVYVLSVKAPVTVTPPSERHPVTVSPHPRQADTSPPSPCHPTPVTVTPRTIIEPSGEPSGTVRARRASTRCPEEFVVTEAMRTKMAAECPGVDLDRETAKFRDHTYAKARSDWPATWRNWMREAYDRRGGRRHSPKQSHGMTYPDGRPVVFDR
jgi:hypothetical protein